MTTALLIFAATYVAIGVGRLPGLRIDRPSASLGGALAMVAAGVVPLERAYRAVDLSTLALLLGLMLLAANLARAGFFGAIADRIRSKAGSPRALLGWIVVASGVLSALFLNDAVCILFTPLVLVIARRAGVPPLPYLLAVATASNVGGACTITGNPQNALIGTMSGISWATFALRLLPASALGLIVVWAVIALVYRDALAREKWGEAPPLTAPLPHAGDAPRVVSGGLPEETKVDRRRLTVCLLVAVAMLGAFLAGVDTSLAALTAGAAVILFTGDGSREPFRGVDWPLLLTFAGLFVVTEGVRASGIADRLLADVGPALAETPGYRIGALSGISLVLSNLVSNVPAVMVLGPALEDAAAGDGAFLALAMSSTFAGNLTLVGSLANLIVAELARAECPIGFVEYLKVGIPITLLTTGIGIAVLVVQGV